MAPGDGLRRRRPDASSRPTAGSSTRRGCGWPRSGRSAQARTGAPARTASSPTCSTAPARPTGSAGSGPSAPGPGGPTASRAARSRSARPSSAAAARCATPARSRAGPTQRRGRARRGRRRARCVPTPTRRAPPARAAPRTHGDRAARAVWLTAESLGDADPALAGAPRAARRLRLRRARCSPAGACRASAWSSSPRRSATLAGRRELEVLRGDPVTALAGRPLAATFAPVPGWRKRAPRLGPRGRPSWPWLARPHARPDRLLQRLAQAELADGLRRC